MIKRILGTLLLIVVLLLVVLGVNTVRHKSRQLVVAAVPAIAIDSAGVADRLAGAIRMVTVSSYEDSTLNAAEFEKLHSMLQTSYPRVHATLTREVVGGLGLLYTWPGANASAAPIVLMAHQDVVPVAPGTENIWKASPFAGEIKDGFVWGRGAWDDKANLIAELEAVELLLSQGYKPAQTVYLAFGADEEVGGYRGAARIAALLESRGVKPAMVLDEGLLVTEGIVPGVKPPAALIGVSEKGFLSVHLKVTATGGHSSMPAVAGGNAIAILSQILTRLEHEQMPARLAGVARETFETLAPEMSGPNRIALSNLWLLSPVVRAQLEKVSSTNANIRTTTALTIIRAGNKDNVIPGVAEATVNFRLLPGDTRASVMEHVRSKIGNANVEVTELPFAAEASPVSSTSSAAYQRINRAVRVVFPGAVVAPGLMVGATDARHFTKIAGDVYRFSPVRARQEDLERFHGTNERISVANLVEMVRFYHELLRAAPGG